jgi:hypothetical protein
MLHSVFLEKLNSDVFLDVIILGSSEFLAALCTKIILKTFSRRVS